jgi:hypothetical protein
VFFFDRWFVVVVAIGLVLVAASVCGIAYTRKLKSRSARIAMWLVSIPVGAIASLAVLLLVAGSGSVSHSIPIYSPSGKMAARIEDADEGATGGSTSVELFWAHGFREQTVYEGGWRSVQFSDIQWKNNTELAVHYSTDYNLEYHCTPAVVVKVSCMPR